MAAPACHPATGVFCFHRASRRRGDLDGEVEHLPLQRSEKEAVVARVTEQLGRASAVVVADYRGLTVSQLGALRRELRPTGTQIHVVKNTLVRRALEAAGLEPMGDVLTGPSLLVLLGEDLSAPIKALLKVAKDTDKLVIKGGLLSGRRVDRDLVVALADLPSREQLLSQFLGLLEAPQRQLLAVLEAPCRDLVGVLDARIRAA